MFHGCDTESPSLPGCLVSYFPSARKCVSHVQKALPFVVLMLRIWLSFPSTSIRQTKPVVTKSYLALLAGPDKIWGNTYKQDKNLQEYVKQIENDKNNGKGINWIV